MKKKRRKVLSTGVPTLLNTEQNLAVSSVVWKSKEETLEFHNGPVIEEGYLEKISLLKDWRERFKPSDKSKPKPTEPRIGRGAQLNFENEAFSGEYNGNVLPPPPMTLEQPQSLPFAKRLKAEPIFGELIDVDGASSSHSNGDKDDSEDSITALAPVIEFSGSKQAIEQCELINGKKSTRTLNEGPGSRRKRKHSDSDEESSDGHPQRPVHAVPLPVRKNLDRPRKQRPIHTTDEGNCDIGSVEPTKSTSDKIKEASDRPPGSIPGGLPIPTKKRGRPKKQKTLDATEEHTNVVLEMPAQATTSAEKKKPGRPKKRKSTPLSKEADAGDLEAATSRTDSKATPNDVPNGSVPSTLLSGSASLGRKRKAPSSKDELFSLPPSKRNSSRIGKTAKVSESTSDLPIRRGRPRKRA